MKRRPSRARRERRGGDARREDAQSGGGAGGAIALGGEARARAREGPREAPVATPGGRVVGFLNERAGRRHARTRAARHRDSSHCHEHSRARDLEISRRAVLWIERPPRRPPRLRRALRRHSASRALVPPRTEHALDGGRAAGVFRAAVRPSRPGARPGSPRRARDHRPPRLAVAVASRGGGSPHETTSALSAARPGGAVTAAGDATPPATPLAPRSARESTRGPRPRRRMRAARMMSRRSTPTPPPIAGAPPPRLDASRPASTRAAAVAAASSSLPVETFHRVHLGSASCVPSALRRVREGLRDLVADAASGAAASPAGTARASRDSSSRSHAASTPSRGSGASTETTRRSRPCSTSPRERPRRRSDPETATTK